MRNKESVRTSDDTNDLIFKDFTHHVLNDVSMLKVKARNSRNLSRYRNHSFGDMPKRSKYKHFDTQKSVYDESSQSPTQAKFMILKSQKELGGRNF